MLAFQKVRVAPGGPCLPVACNLHTLDQKHKLERSGFRYIESLLKPYHPDIAKGVMEAWLDYEEGRTPEGRWVKEMDKFECLTQAHEYEQQTYGAKDLSEFQGLTAKVQSPEGREWLGLLQAERESHFSKRKHRTPVVFAPNWPHTMDAGIQKMFAADDAWLQCCSLGGILRERAEDATFPHAEYFKYCLEEALPVPTDLVVRILDQKIEQGVEQGKWTLLCGFPKDMESNYCRV
jgi:hypothetical protein